MPMSNDTDDTHEICTYIERAAKASSSYLVLHAHYNWCHRPGELALTCDGFVQLKAVATDPSDPRIFRLLPDDSAWGSLDPTMRTVLETRHAANIYEADITVDDLSDCLKSYCRTNDKVARHAGFGG
jgi:hypothetical protein